MTANYLVITVLLLIANGFFVAAEFALTAARWTRLEELAAAGDRRGKVALASIRELSFMLAGAQLGITMASLGLGFVAEPAIAHLLQDALRGIVTMPASALHTVSLVIALVIVVFLHMVIGEMAPKNLAISEAERTALWLAIPFRIYANIFRPILHVMNMLANGLLRLVKVEPQDELFSKHTAGELAAMIEESAKQGMIREFEHRLLSGAVSLGERDAASVLVPRTELVAVPRSAAPEYIERMVLETGHSRILVYGEGLDDMIGFFHAKDLLKVEKSARERPLAAGLIRPLLIVPESRKLRPLLVDMRRERQHLALVIDEHGGTAGVVTLEDVLEELVGEIRDEYDAAEHGIERIGPDKFLVPGTLRIDEAAERLGVELPKSDDYETVAGFLMDRLGRVPKRGDTVQHDGWLLRIRTMYRRRVVEVQIERSKPAAVEGAEASIESTG